MIKKTFMNILTKLDSGEDDTKLDITPSKIQTKDWRNRQEWYFGGKKTECEVRQRKDVEIITARFCRKTNVRINLENYTLVDKKNPMTKNKKPIPGGYEYTEDFDGEQIISDKRLYYNFKSICEPGGAQTRSLREVYHFIKAQLDHLLIHNSTNTHFINILDGAESHFRRPHFTYLLNKQRYEDVRKYIYVGDLYHFVDWYKMHVRSSSTD